MKLNIKFKIFFLVFFISFFHQQTFSDSPFELYFHNETAGNLTVKIYPVSMVMNGENQYSLLSRWRKDVFGDPLKFHYNGGVRTISGVKYTTITISGVGVEGLNYDDPVGGANPPTTAIGSFGAGIYKIEFSWSFGISGGNDEIYIEQDAGFNLDLRLKLVGNTALYGGPIGAGVIYSEAREGSTNWGPEKWVGLTNNYIKIWDPYPYITNEWRRAKEFGNFVYDAGNISLGNPYTFIPLDSRQNCYLTTPPFSFGDQNHRYPANELDPPEERQGTLTLNLTIAKNEDNLPTEIKTPVSFWVYNHYQQPAPIIITSGATLKIAKGISNLERKLTFKKFNNVNIGTGLYINPMGKLWLEGSSNVNEKSHVYFESYCNSEIDQYGVLQFGANSQITFSGNSFMRLNPHAGIYGATGATMFIKDNAIVHDCGADKIPSNGLSIIETGNGEYRYTPGYCGYDYTSENEALYSKVIDDGGSYVLNDQSVLMLGPNCKITFDGPESFLIANPGTTIRFGANAKIEFINGAYIQADGVNFIAENGTDIWSGIKLENAGSQTIIQNCTFSNTAAPITIVNTSGNENLNKVIKNNTFNLPVGIPGGSTAIYSNNVFQLLVENNIFNLGGSDNTGISIYNTSSSESGDGPSGPPSSYSLNILSNTFNGWGQKIIINCLASNLTPFLIKSNRFYSTPYSEYNAIFANKITGDIKYNEFYDQNHSTAISLQQSTVNVYSNIFKSTFNSLDLQSGSIAQIAPVFNGSQWVWYGGYNLFTADAGSCIYFSSGSNPITSPNGKNCFYTLGQPHYKITGVWCSSKFPDYNSYDNYWSPSPPVFNIICNGNPVTVNYNPALSICPTREYGDFTISDAGNGVIDTLFTTSAGEGGSVSSSSK